jgi:outer membrane protein TolC
MSKRIIKIILSFSFCLVFVSSLTSRAFAQTVNLSLSNYLNQVKKCNEGLQGSVMIATGALQRAGEGRLLTTPKFFAEGQYLKNRYDPNWSPIAGNSNTLQSYQVGVSQTTPYGVQGKLYYNYQHQTINGISPLINSSQATATSPVLELTVPLARNWAGRETRASAQLITQQAYLTQYLEGYKIKMLIAQAESAYWRLAITRNIVGIQRDSLKRAQKIEQWVQKRAGLRLAEEADTLQAKAAVMAKELDIQVAMNDEKLSARNFNTLRGSNQDNVYEQLCSYSKDVRPSLPAYFGPREDVKASEAQEKIAIANAQLGIEKNKPDVDLYASYALNGNNPSSNAAVSQSFSLDYPSTAVGLRLSMPLDFWRLAKIRKGYTKEIKGATCQYKQKRFEDKRLWEDLVVKLKNVSERFELASQLEKIQLLKLQAERTRLSNGKTTTYQVLIFEQDYANSQISRLALQDEMLGLISQLKTFGVRDEPV